VVPARISSGRDAERHHACLPALVDQDVVQLQVAMRDACIVAECEAAQHALDPRGRVFDRRLRMLRQPFLEGDACGRSTAT
jgi:hypothetical protein